MDLSKPVKGTIMSTVSYNAQHRNLDDILRRMQEVQADLQKALVAWTTHHGPLPEELAAKLYLSVNTMGHDLDEHNPALEQLWVLEGQSLSDMLEAFRQERDYVYTVRVPYLTLED